MRKTRKIAESISKGELPADYSESTPTASQNESRVSDNKSKQKKKDKKKDKKKKTKA